VRRSATKLELSQQNEAAEIRPTALTKLTLIRNRKPKSIKKLNLQSLSPKSEIRVPKDVNENLTP